MKTISIINLKGGTGKTTTTAAMAEDLALRFGMKVLMIDNDKQGNLSRLYKWFSMNGEAGACKMLKDSKINKQIRPTVIDDMNIVPCNYFMEYAEATINKEKTRKYFHYQIALNAIKDQYDYCIIDNPPDLGINVINALVASDEVIIPLNLDAYSIEGLKELMQQIGEIKTINKNIKLIRCLVTNVEKTSHSILAEEWLREKGFLVFGTHIRHSKCANESTFSGQSIVQSNKRSGAAQDYKKIHERIYGG